MLLIVIAFVTSIVGQACQRAMAIQYVKYDSDAAIPRISIGEAKKEFEAGNAVIIDARAEAFYKDEHIAGSINIPYGASEDQFQNLPVGKKLIVYCSCGSEHTSSMLAYEMNQKGVPGTYALVGGTNAWKNAGYPMEKSQ